MVDLHKVGDFYADYSELTAEEIAAPSGCEELLARSRVVSSKTLFDGEKGFRRYTIPRFDNGRFFVLLPDGSEVEENPLTIKVQAEMWQAATDAAFVWFAARKPCDSG